MQELNTRDVTPELRKILLVGQEGSGKTHFIGTMPKPIYVFSFDKGYQTVAGMDGIRVGLVMDDNRYKPTAYKDFEAQFEKLRKGELKFTWADGREEAYKTIAIDSISFLSTFCFDHLQYINSNIDKPGGYAVYGAVKSKLQDVINKAIVAAEYVVATALIEVTKDELTGEIFHVPSMIGSLKNEVGAWFDAVLYLKTEKKPTGEVQYKALTVGGRTEKAKVRVPSGAGRLLPVEVPDFEVIAKKIAGGKG
jgi:hypothetical protein